MHDIGMGGTGWWRLWVVVSGFAIAIAAAISAYGVWAIPPCYKFITLTPSESITAEDRRTFEWVSAATIEKEVCSTSLFDPLPTLEGLADNGALTQVSLDWLEPQGWAGPTTSGIAIYDGKEIKAEAIIADMSKFVRLSRLPRAGWTIVSAVALSLLLLVLGCAVGWVRRGFREGRS